MTLGVSWVSCITTWCLASYHRIPSVSPRCCFFGIISLFLYDILLLGLRINIKLRLKGTNSSFFARVVSSRLDGLLFIQFSHLHLLFFGHRISDCLEVLLTLNLPYEGLCWLISGLSNMDRLHTIALLHDHLTMMRYCGIKILTTLLWLGPNNNDYCLQLSILD